MFTKSSRNFGAENCVFQIVVRLAAEIHNQMLSINTVFRWFLARLSFFTLPGRQTGTDKPKRKTEEFGSSGESLWYSVIFLPSFTVQISSRTLELFVSEERKMKFIPLAFVLAMVSFLLAGCR